MNVIDDTAYFQNNITLRTSWSDPVLNFTAMIAGNFSDATVECYEFSYSMYTNSRTNFQLFGSFGNWVLAFLFNQMGNALAFKSIFDDIAADQANGYYTDIAY